MEYSDAAALELYRIRVLLSRFVIFVAIFLLLVVGPVLGWLSWVGYVWTLRPIDADTQEQLRKIDEEVSESMRQAEAAAEQVRRAWAR